MLPGKTTLLDVIALRKGGVISLGKSKGMAGVSGEVLLNGFPQEEESFRRCSGYVEQFDVQTPGEYCMTNLYIKWVFSIL